MKENIKIVGEREKESVSGRHNLFSHFHVCLMVLFFAQVRRFLKVSDFAFFVRIRWLGRTWTLLLT